MANALYTKLANTVVDLLGKFGTRATLLKRTPSIYDPATSTNTIPAITDSGIPFVAVFNFSSSEIKNSASMIKEHDAKVLMDAKSTLLVPDVGDLLIVKSTNCTIINVKSMQPDGETVIVYELQVRPMAGPVVR